jgi:hypothetical protein
MIYWIRTTVLVQVAYSLDPGAVRVQGEQRGSIGRVNISNTTPLPNNSNL